MLTHCRRVEEGVACLGGSYIHWSVADLTIETCDSVFSTQHGVGRGSAAPLTSCGVGNAKTNFLHPPSSSSSYLRGAARDLQAPLIAYYVNSTCASL
jgi:hypothetical protein